MANNVIRDFYSTIGEKDGFSSDMPSKTMQEFVDDCDINHILNSFNSTGVLPPSQQVDSMRIPEFIDVSSLPETPQEFYDIFKRAQDSFDLLPVEIKERFNHDKEKFVEFALDPKNADALCDLGLATRRSGGYDIENALVDKVVENAVKKYKDAEDKNKVSPPKE
jgi:hypothetical protein